MGYNIDLVISHNVGYWTNIGISCASPSRIGFHDIIQTEQLHFYLKVYKDKHILR